MSPWAQISIASAVISFSVLLWRALSDKEPTVAAMRRYNKRQVRRSDFLGWAKLLCVGLVMVAASLLIVTLPLLPITLAAVAHNGSIVWFEVPLLLFLLALRSRRDRLRLDSGGVQVETFSTREDSLAGSAIERAVRGWWL